MSGGLTDKERNLLVSIAKSQLVLLKVASVQIINMHGPQTRSGLINAIGRAQGHLEHDLESMGEKLP